MQKAKQFFSRDKGEAEDPQFEVSRNKFKQIRKDLQTLQETLKKQVKQVSGLVKPLDELALSVNSFYEAAARPGSEHSEQGKKFSRGISGMQRLVEDFENQHNIVQDTIGNFLSKTEAVKKEVEERDKLLERFQDKKKEYSAAQTKEKDPLKVSALKDKFQTAKEAYDESNDKVSTALNNIIEQACDEVEPAYQRLISMHAKLFSAMASSFSDMGDDSSSSSRSQPSPRANPRLSLAQPLPSNPDSLAPPERPARTSVYGLSPSAIEAGGANPPLPSRSMPPPPSASTDDDQPTLPSRPTPSLPAREPPSSFAPPTGPRGPALPSRDGPALPSRESSGPSAASLASAAVAAAPLAAQPPLPARNRTSVYGMDGSSIQQQQQESSPALPARQPSNPPTQPMLPTRPGPSPSQPPLPQRGMPPMQQPEQPAQPQLPTRPGPSPSQPPLPQRSVPSEPAGGPPSLPGRGPAPAPATAPSAAIPAGLLFPVSVIPEEEQKKYSLIFKREDPENLGQITGQKAIGLFGRSGLPQQELALVWELADQNKDGSLSIEEFVIAMFLINSKLMGRIPEIPDELPSELVIRSGASAPPAMPSRNYGAPAPQQPSYGSQPQPSYGGGAPSLPSRGPAPQPSYGGMPSTSYGGGAPPSLPGRGGPPQPQMSMREQMDAKADEVGAQMRQKAQQKAGEEAAKAAMNEKNQEAFGNYVAENSDNALVGSVAKNKWVQQQGGSFLAKKAQDEKVQQAAGDMAIRGAKSGAKHGASAARTGASNFNPNSFITALETRVVGAVNQTFTPRFYSPTHCLVSTAPNPQASMDQNITSLPSDVLVIILSNVPLADLVNVSCVCQGWKATAKAPVVRDNMVQVSVAQILEEYPGTCVSKRSFRNSATKKTLFTHCYHCEIVAMFYVSNRMGKMKSEMFQKKLRMRLQRYQKELVSNIILQDDAEGLKCMGARYDKSLLSARIQDEKEDLISLVIRKRAVKVLQALADAWALKRPEDVSGLEFLCQTLAGKSSRELLVRIAANSANPDAVTSVLISIARTHTALWWLTIFKDEYLSTSMFLNSPWSLDPLVPAGNGKLALHHIKFPSHFADFHRVLGDKILVPDGNGKTSWDYALDGMASLAAGMLEHHRTLTRPSNLLARYLQLSQRISVDQRSFYDLFSGPVNVNTGYGEAEALATSSPLGLAASLSLRSGSTSDVVDLILLAGGVLSDHEHHPEASKLQHIPVSVDVFRQEFCSRTFECQDRCGDFYSYKLSIDSSGSFSCDFTFNSAGRDYWRETATLRGTWKFISPRVPEEQLPVVSLQISNWKSCKQLFIRFVSTEMNLVPVLSMFPRRHVALVLIDPKRKNQCQIADLAESMFLNPFVFRSSYS